MDNVSDKEIKSITYHNVFTNSEDAKLIVVFVDDTEEVYTNKMDIDKIVNKFKKQTANKYSNSLN